VDFFVHIELIDGMAMCCKSCNVTFFDFFLFCLYDVAVVRKTMLMILRSQIFKSRFILLFL